ncbi:hypothetical protein [Methanoregula sp.]|uniref:hypothetical protein n=1 Tax=Methanoregula sp. TaxID=2052170 RepID=UPI003C73B409
MSTMLPSGIATLLCKHLAVQPDLAFISVHVAPLSVDRHVSFLGVPSTPPMRTMLPSGIVTLLKYSRADHPAPGVI